MSAEIPQEPTDTAADEPKVNEAFPLILSSRNTIFPNLNPPTHGQ